MIKKIFVLHSLLMVSGITLFGQGPVTGFMPGKKNMDLAISYSTETFSTYLFGKEEQHLALTTQSVSLFLERGLSDSFSLVVTLPYLWIDDENKGLQDAQIFLKYRNQKIRYPTSYLSFITAIGLSFPVSSYPSDSETPIGEKATVFQGRFLMQYQLESGLFFHLQSGINFRLIPTAQSSLPILLRSGYGMKKFYFEGWIEFLKTFNSGVDMQVLGGAGSDWTKIGGTVYYSITPKLGIFVSGSNILSGRNIGLGKRFNTGLVWKL